MSLVQYARFLFIGGFVGVVTVAVRELIALLLGTDTRVSYSLSVVLAYAIGIAVSFLLNRKFTFSKKAAGRAEFMLFVAVAMIGMVFTWLIALALRYGVDLEFRLGRYAAAVSFATAAILSSLISYPLNAVLVFRQRKSSLTASD